MKHWVFDLDGTLVDSFRHYFAFLEELFREHGATFSDELRYPAITQNLPEFFERHLGSDAVPAALATLQARSNGDALEIRGFEGMVPALETLSSRGARIAVWTNRDLESARLILAASGLERLAELCVSGTCVSRRKPDPEGLLRIVEHFGCEPAAVTMVGDHEHDVAAAKEVGARAVRASWHGYWAAEPCSMADAQFFRIADFANWARSEQIR